MPRARERKLFIHVGPAKTGSTSIQAMLHRLSASLEQVGVHVVAAGERAGNHGNLVRPAYGTDPAGFRFPEGQWRSLRHELMHCRASRFVVSAEQFSRPASRAESVRRFREIATAANLDVEVIACVRPQWQLLEAAWSLRIGSGAVTPPFAGCLDEGLNEERMDYGRVLAPWKDAFGAVTVIPLERSRLPRGLLARLLDTLEVRDARIVAAARRLPHLNLRRGAKLLEVRRLVAVALHGHGLAEWQRARCLGRLGGLARLLDDDPPFAPLSRRQMGDVMDRFAHRNARFAREFGVDAAGDLFRDEPGDALVRPTVAAWDEFSEDERLAAVDFVASRIGLLLPAGGRERLDAAGVPRASTSADVEAKIREPGCAGLRNRARGLVAGCMAMLRGLSQMRVSSRGWLVLRWLYWRLRRRRPGHRGER